MLLLDELRAEHLLVDRVAGSLVRFAEQAARGDCCKEDVTDFVRFFRIYVSGFHHGREEQRLFPALIDRAEVPADRGPLPAIEEDHGVMAEMVDTFDAEKGDPARVSEIARRLAHHLWEHVDKENSVLLPEAADRLRRNGVVRLEGRDPTDEEEAARELGKDLCERYPPLDDPGFVRGDGCIACSAFGETCGGIESEWWNSWERQHYRNLDEG
jgi:hemerythrin-like domain-containing protein